MSITIDASGLTIQTYDEILAELITSVGVALNLTEAQVQRIRDGVRSTLGQMVRIEAEREAVMGEALLEVYGTLTLLTEGVALDRVVRLLGVTRRPAVVSRVLGLITGTPAAALADGVRLRYNPRGTVWRVVDGPYVVGGGGTIVDVPLEAEESAAHEVALDPATGFDDWTILDTAPGISAFESTEQPVVGSAIEADNVLRARAEIEAFRRAQGPLRAIEAAVRAVPGVTYARAYENRTLVTNADGIPGKAINVIAEGGTDAGVAAAIWASRPAGAELFGLAGGSLVSESVVDDWGFAHTVAFNRLTTVPIWIQATLTTSTSEQAATPGLADAVAALLLARAPAIFGIGADVLPWKLIGAIDAEGYSGIDDVAIELSLDDGGSDPYSAARRVISIRERAAFDAARITVTEA